MKRRHLHSRSTGLAVSTALFVALTLLLSAVPATAADDKPLPPGWSDWSEQSYDGSDIEGYPHGGGGPTLTLLYLDVDALNAAVDAARGAGWDPPFFSTDQPMLLWGGMGGGGLDSFRAGGGGAGGELRVETKDGASSFSLGYGGFQFHRVLRPGVDPEELTLFNPMTNPYPGGRFRVTLGGQVGFGGYELKLTDNDRSTEPFPAHRETSQSFVFLAPEMGVEFSLTPATNLRLSASYFYPVGLGGTKADPDIHPDPVVLQNLAVSVGLLFGIF